jgi:adenylate cyclase
MATSRIDRRLAAILAADLVGYTRLMQHDEQGTLERLTAHRKEFVEPLIAEHGGRIVKLMGDGLLCEFASAVDAVRCAVLLQQGMIEREAGRREEDKIRFRIGINLADIIHEDGDVYGDGVNLAARLQALAEPGGIWIARNIHNQVKSKLPFRFAPLGTRCVKNIAEPVEVWRVVPDGTAAQARMRARHVLPLAVLLLLLGGGLWWLGRAEPLPSLPVAPPEASATASSPDRPPTAPAPRLSIVVLPFANLTGDPGQDYFADGITEGLTTDLSRIDGSFVIARHTAFTYQGRKDADVRAVGRELGVRYVLEGSVQRVGAWVGINAQLVDTATGAYLWAEQFEGSRDDLLTLYHEMTGRIAATLRLELIEAEGRRVEREQRPDPMALDDAMRGWALLHRPNSRETRAEARRLFERALASDLNTVSALVGLAHVLEGRTDTPTEDRQRAEDLLRRALDLEPNRADTYLVLGLVRRSQGRLEEAAEALENAIALDRNYARAHLQLGVTANLLGRPEEAIVHAQRAIRLNPRDPNLADAFFAIGVAHQLLGHVDEAIHHLERARAGNPRLWYIHWHLAAAYASAQRLEDARQALAVHQRLRPEFRSIAAITAALPQVNHPAFQELCERTLYVGLRRAGFPDT